MEMRQLEYFLAVADEGNFTRAAERVHISQSGVSAQLRQLERELGVQLIDRSGRTATVTVAGAAVLEHARAALASADAARRAADEVTNLVRGRLVVGMVTACTVTPLFDALAAFHRAHPGVELSLVEDNSDVLVEQVRAGTTDLALIGTGAAPPADLPDHTIVSERIVAAVANDHPLARRRRVTLSGIVDHPLVCLPRGTGIRRVFDGACAARGMQPHIALEASAPAAVADLAARGLGVAILSETTATGHQETLTVLRLDVATPVLLSLVWSHSPSPASTAFVAHCRDAFGSGTHPRSAAARSRT